MSRNEWQILGSEQLFDGHWMVLDERTTLRGGAPLKHYRLRVAGFTLMEVPNATESSQKLAEVALDDAREKTAPWVLVGGLGFGLTLGAVLDRLPAGGRVVVSELYPKVVEWNRQYLRELEGRRLEDGRVELVVEDVAERIAATNQQFDAILLDVDNGPYPFHREANRWLYTAPGIAACKRALTRGGVLAVWSAFEDTSFERRLTDAGLVPRKAIVGSLLEKAVIFVGRKI